MAKLFFFLHFRQNAVKFEDVAGGLAFFQPESFFNSIAFVIGLSLFASAFILFPLVERVTNAKQVQMMTGVNPVIFWLSNLVWDFGLFFLSSLLLFMIVSVLDDTHTYTTNGRVLPRLEFQAYHRRSCINPAQD